MPRRLAKAVVKRIPAKRLLGQSFFYLAVNLVAAFGPLLLIPFLTKVLPPFAYGTYGNFLAGVGVLGVLLGLNMDIVVRRHGHDSNEELGKWISAALTVMLGMTLLSLLVVLILGYWWPEVAELSGVPVNYLPLMVLGGALMAMSSVSSFVATMKERLFAYGVLRLGGTFLFVALTFGFYLGLRHVVGDVLLARITSLLIVAAGGIWWLWRLELLQLSRASAFWQRIPAGLAYGIPLIPSMFYDSAMTLVNRVALTQGADLAATGHYTLAYQLSQPLQLLTGSLGMALFPWMTRWLNENTPEAHRKLLMAGGGAVVFFAAVWLIYVVGLLPIVMTYLGNGQYSSSIDSVMPLSLGFIIGGGGLMLSTRYLHSGDTWWITACCIVGLVVNLGVSWWMPRDVIVAWGFAAGYLATCLGLAVGRPILRIMKRA